MTENNSESFYYNTVEQAGQAEFKDRGSRFIAYVYPLADVADFKEKLAALKKNIPKLYIIVLLTGWDSTAYLSGQ